MKTRKYLLISLAVCVTLILSAIGLTAAYFDTAQIKRTLISNVLTNHQRTLQIDGDLTLMLWPSIGVHVSHATLSEHGSTQTFAAFDEARLALQIRPLLSQRVVVDQISITGLKATLLRRPDGSLNIADFLNNDTPDKRASNVEIAAIRLEHAALIWRDEQSGQTLKCGELNLQTGRISNDAAQGQIVLNDLVLNTQGLAAGDLDSTPNKPLAGLTDLALNLQVGRIVMQNNTQPARHAFTITDLQLNASGKLNADLLTLQMTAPQLLLADDQNRGSRLTLVVTHNNAVRQSHLKLDLSDLEAHAQVVHAASAALSFDTQSKLDTQNASLPSSSIIKGQLASPLHVDLTGGTLDLPQLTGALDIHQAQLRMPQLTLPITANLHADLTQQNATGHLNSQHGLTHLTADFNVPRFAPFAMIFNIDIDQLDLDQYLLPTKPSVPVPAPSDSAPLDLSALRNLDLQGHLHLGMLQLAGVKARQVKLEVKSGNGQFNIAAPTAKTKNNTKNPIRNIDITPSKVN